MWVLERFKVISYKELNKEIASVWLPVNILFIIMLVSGAFAYVILYIFRFHPDLSQDQISYRAHDHHF